MTNQIRLMFIGIFSAKSNAAPSPSVGMRLLLAIMLLCPMANLAQAVPPAQPEITPQAPPPAFPVQVRAARPQGGPTKKGLTPTLYSIGQPTDEEQLYLEWINRSRANPTAAGQLLASTTDPQVVNAYSLFKVDLVLMQSEFSTNPPVPPLAMNAQLLAAARWHSGDMFTNQYQGHYQTNGSSVLDPGGRISATGYGWQTYGENVYAYAKSVFYGYAGFDVDWGVAPPTGMQNPPGHRNNIHDSRFREAGIGVVDGMNGSVGPQLVTQDFATSQSATPLISGVVYHDLNGNGFYDVGEGLDGVTVTVDGSEYYAVTANSGGYAVPVTTNGAYTVTFSAPGLVTNMQVVTVSHLDNVKLDYLAVYSPPVLQVVASPTVSGGQLQLDFSVANYQTGMTFQLWKAIDSTGTWTQDNLASLQNLVPNSRFRFTTSTGGSDRNFYRVRAVY